MQPESTIKPRLCFSSSSNRCAACSNSLEKAFGDKRGEVLVAFVVGGEQRDVRFVANGAIEAARRRDVRLQPMIGFKPCLRALSWNSTARTSRVIGQRDAGRALIGRAAA